MSDPSRPLLTAGFEEALGRCEFVVDRRWTAATVTGPAGAGKTTLLDAAAEAVAGDRVDVIRFGRDPYDKFGVKLVGSVEAGRHVAVLADDLDLLPHAVATALTQIVKGVSRREDGRPAVTCIATATDADAVPRFFRTDSLPIALGPLGVDEIDGYVAHRLSRLGLASTAVPAASRRRLAAAASCLPGRIDRLLDVALADRDVRADVIVRPESVDAAAAVLGYEVGRNIDELTVGTADAPLEPAVAV